MDAVCPHCDRPLELTRAPVARIVGLKVVSFCSSECAEAAARGEPARPRAVQESAVPAVIPPVGTDQPRPAAPAEELQAIGLAAVEEPEEAEPPAPTRAERDEEAASGTAPLRAPFSVAAVSLKKLVVAAASSAVLLLGLVIVAVEACPSSTDVRAAAVTAPADRHQISDRTPIAHQGEVVAEETASPGEIDPQRLYDHAVENLRALMQSRSKRVQRVAAMALSRTGDKQAVERLRSMSSASPSSLVKVQIAYCLARAGEEKGRQDLVDSLSARERDARLDAARSLVKLGDKAGAKVLRNLLSYRRFRIGAAGLLARLGDKRGLKALREARKDRGVSTEIKMRAAVSLGRAGDASVRADLTSILGAGKYQVGAAQALAALGDRVAVPALTKQLGLDSFRVTAALSLRRLGEEVDLEPLAVALQTGNDVARVTSAEAILILTGSENLAEID